MKYTVKLETVVNVPDDSKYVLIYTKKNGDTKAYGIAEIINQNNKYLRANVINKGPRTFISNRIVNLSPV